MASILFILIIVVILYLTRKIKPGNGTNHFNYRRGPYN